MDTPTQPLPTIRRQHADPDATGVFRPPSALADTTTVVPPAADRLATDRLVTEPLLPPEPILATTEPAPGNSRRRRVAQGAVLVGLAVLVAGLALSLPNRGSVDTDAAQSTTRVETEGPVASASLLSGTGQFEVDGQLADAGELATGERASLDLIDRAGSGPTTETALPPTDRDLGNQAAPATTTTTAWVEPSLPSESDWVDSGNGVLVPDIQLRIRFCESTNNYTAANGWSSARGAYQFLTKSWEWYGHAERFGVAQAHLATPAQQDQAALATLQAEGTGPWAESRPCWNDPDLDPRYATAAPPTTAAQAPTTSPTTTTGSSESTTTVDSSSTTETTTSSSTTESTTTSTTEAAATTPTS